ncbi:MULTISPECIES: hydrogenase/urease maturation nickel metallochaperone HypA [unclassified Frankia]|uniref:hydrogenase/urease maturation nickel metallochaperone HypA n=1 Tax=unclassified Frankia TaxID=2632575 RepID=UPI002AD422B8|nr:MULTISPECIES: hydrogenase/urease maturation nickel metallochaperone HypA [unclassified Frankia]
MHEAGLARAAVAALVEASAGAAVRTVVLAVGTGVDIDSAAAAWHGAATGTCLQASHVEWRTAVDRLRCFACVREYDGERLDVCPSCGGNGIVIAAADELTVVDWTT